MINPVGCWELFVQDSEKWTKPDIMVLKSHDEEKCSV